MDRREFISRCLYAAAGGSLIGVGIGQCSTKAQAAMTIPEGLHFSKMINYNTRDIRSMALLDKDNVIHHVVTITATNNREGDRENLKRKLIEWLAKQP